MPMLRNNDIADLLHGASTEILEDARVEVTRPRLLDHMASTFSLTMVLFPVKIARSEVVVNQNSPSAFMRMLTEKLMAPIRDAYRYMVEYVGMRPDYYIDPRRDKDYLDGFVA